MRFSVRIVSNPWTLLLVQLPEIPFLSIESLLCTQCFQFHITRNLLDCFTSDDLVSKGSLESPMTLEGGNKSPMVQ